MPHGDLRLALGPARPHRCRRGKRILFDINATVLFDTPPRVYIKPDGRIAIPIFWGRWGLLIQRKVPIRVVFGEPLRLRRGSASDASKASKADTDAAGKAPGAPTPEEVSAAHAAYVAALTKLFDENKGRFGYGDRELRIH